GYIQYTATDGTYVRPVFTQYNRVTKKTVALYLLTDLVTFARDITGGVFGDTYARIFNDGVNGTNFNLDPATYAAGTFLHINSHAGTEARLYLGVAGGVETAIRNFQSGSLDISVNGSSDSLHIYATPNGGAGDAIAVGANDNGAVATFNNSSAQNALPVVRARGRSGQTADLFRAESNTPATL